MLLVRSFTFDCAHVLTTQTFRHGELDPARVVLLNKLSTNTLELAARDFNTRMILLHNNSLNRTAGLRLERGTLLDGWRFLPRKKHRQMLMLPSVEKNTRCAGMWPVHNK